MTIWMMVLVSIGVFVLVVIALFAGLEIYGQWQNKRMTRRYIDAMQDRAYRRNHRRVEEL